MCVKKIVVKSPSACFVPGNVWRSFITFITKLKAIGVFISRQSRR
jgi:hypothetical protein